MCNAVFGQLGFFGAMGASVKLRITVLFQAPWLEGFRWTGETNVKNVAIVGGVSLPKVSS
jgi:hypothetical protein